MTRLTFDLVRFGIGLKGSDQLELSLTLLSSFGRFFLGLRVRVGNLDAASSC